MLSKIKNKLTTICNKVFPESGNGTLSYGKLSKNEADIKLANEYF